MGQTQRETAIPTDHPAEGGPYACGIMQMALAPEGGEMSKRRLEMNKKPHRIRNFVLGSAVILLVIIVIVSLQQNKETTVAPPTTEGPTAVSTTPQEPQTDIAPVAEPNTLPEEPQVDIVTETVEIPEPVETITIPEPTTPPKQETIGDDQEAHAILTESGKEMAISAITDYSEVLDAAVRQEGLQLSLALIVLSGTSEQRAKELGDNFVRLIKSLGFIGTPTGEQPPQPEKRIGKGPFTYLIGVYRPDESRIVTGAKVAGADHITW